MSMQTMQSILCRGAVDQAFMAELLAAPRRALQEYDLDAAEIGLLTGARSLHELATRVEDWRTGRSVHTTVRERELALALAS